MEMTQRCLQVFHAGRLDLFWVPNGNETLFLLMMMIFFFLHDNYFAPIVHFTEYVAEHWKEDEFFGYQFLNGLNPNRIKKCSELPQNFPVTEEMVKPFLKDGSSLKEEMKVRNSGPIPAFF